MGGREAEEKLVPWVLKLTILKRDGETYVCGGSLLTERHLLTAAHCTHDARKSFKCVRDFNDAHNSVGSFFDETLSTH